MAKVIVYSKPVCPYCDRAKALLQEKNIAYTEVRVDQDPEALALMMEKSGQRTVPQIFINDRSIGGFDDLWALEQAGELDPMLVD
jgi:glutaredoxin 3